MKQRSITVSGLLAGLVLFAPAAQADIVRGVQEIVGGVLQVPLSTLAGTLNGPPILGTLLGAIGGLVNGLGLVTHGALEIGASGLAIAKTVAPYVLPFVL